MFELSVKRAPSSSGRAPHLHCGGERFEPAGVHQKKHAFWRVFDFIYKKMTKYYYLVII